MNSNNQKQTQNQNQNSSKSKGAISEIINAESLRKKYIIQFVVLFIVIIVLYIYNPYGVFTTYAGPTIFISLFLCFFLVVMILFYDYLFKHPHVNPTGVPKDLSGNLLFVLFSFIVSGGFIVLLLWSLGMFSSDTSTSSNGVINFIINFLLLFLMLSIVYKILSLSAFGKFPVTRIIIYSFLYIPCLFVSLMEMVMKELNTTTKSEVILLVVVCILILLYLVFPIFIRSLYNQGGKQLVNQPLPLDSENIIGTYQSLNNSDELNYRYAISFWFFIDSMSPSTNSNYAHFTNILSYGKNPNIRYNVDSNSLIITVTPDSEKILSVVDVTHKLERKLDVSSDDQIKPIRNVIKQVINKVKNVPLMNELDEQGNRIIYLKKGVLLQRWNNIILNYDGGTLDVFYNGELVKSAIEVVPYLTYDTLVVGANHGISGGIANVVYFKEPLDIFKINKLYTSMKDKNPPSLPNNNQTIIPNT